MFGKNVQNDCAKCIIVNTCNIVYCIITKYIHVGVWKVVELLEWLNVIENYGIGIACIVYFMFRDYKFTTELTKSLASLNAVLKALENKIHIDEGGTE